MVSREQPTFPLYLGAGGTTPGVWAFDPHSQQVRSLIGLATGQSVYTVTVAVDVGVMAYGTRQGCVRILRITELCSTDTPPQDCCWDVGAPVLSVCIGDSSQVITSDTAGRCLVWDITALEATPRLLPCDGRIVCAMRRLPDGLLAGLASDGQLLLWRLSTGGLISSIAGHPPPRPHALVCLSYLQSKNALFYPSADGHLVVWSPDEQRVAAVLAHEDGFFVADVLGEQFLTVGHDDGRVVHWSIDAAVPAVTGCMEGAPQGVVAGCVLDDGGPQLLLVDERGRAAIYDVGDDRLREVHALFGSGCRVIARPNPERVRAWMARWRRDEATRIVQRIKEQLDAGTLEVNDADDQRLITLGYEHASLGLRAEAARQSGNELAELEHRHALAKILPDEAESVESLQRFVELLTRFWRFPLADTVRGRIETITGQRYRGGDLEDYAEAMGTGNWVIDPEGQIPRMIEAASVLNTPFSGRYILRRGSPVTVPGTRLDLARIAAKYEQGRTESTSDALPRPVAEPLWWLSRDDVQERPTVLLANNGTENAVALEVALCVEHDGIQNVVTPAVLVHIPERFNNLTDPVAYNRFVASALEAILSRSTTRSWVAKVDSALTMTLRRLSSETVATTFA